MDNKITQLLNSPKVEDRKQAIKALAQSNDEASLKYLATIYKTDSDAEVRELSLKAGRYLKKQLDEAAKPSLFAEEDEKEARAKATAKAKKEAEEIAVSEADKVRANGMVQQAMELHTRGDNAKAMQTLERAFSINPALADDKFAVGLAATITGLPGDEALRELEEAIHKGKSRQQKYAAAVAQESQTHRALAIMFMMGALVTLIGFLTLPWIDMNSVETEVEATGEKITLGEQFQQFKELTDSLAALFGNSLSPREQEAFDLLLQIFDSFRITFTGVEATRALVGEDLLSVLGLPDVNALEEIATDYGIDLGDFDTAKLANTPGPLDFSLLLIPVASILGMLIGLLLMINRSASLFRWMICMLIAVMGLAPCVYFFITGAENFLALLNDSTIFGILTLPNPAVFGAGYWTSAIGVAVMVLMSLLAMLVPQPHETKEKVKNEE